MTSQVVARGTAPAPCSPGMTRGKHSSPTRMLGVLCALAVSRASQALEEARGPIVAAIPANGWVAIFREEDGALTPDPIVGWAVGRSGAVHPIGMGRNGSVEYPTDIGNFVQLLAPGEQLEDVDDE